MTRRQTVLCPVDYSDASRSALRYARWIAAHLGARLIILSVEDPLLTEALDLGTSAHWDPEDARRELARFTSKALGGNPLSELDVTYAIEVGKPAPQIMHVAQEESCDLIVMATHGLTGMRKMFFGSTTERVLRETTVPVLATPPSAEGLDSIDDLRGAVGRILVPVDLSSASLHQVQVAGAVADAVKVPLLLTHVVEPVRSPMGAKLELSHIEAERASRATVALDELLATLPRQSHPEALVAHGHPAEEIAKVARDRRAGLIVIGLHGSPLLGPRMGSVTYRVLCLTSVPVLALPPRAVGNDAGTGGPVHSFVHK